MKITIRRRREKIIVLPVNTIIFTQDYHNEKVYLYDHPQP